MRYKVLKHIITPMWEYKIDEEVDGNKIHFTINVEPENHPEWFEEILDLENLKKDVQYSKNLMEYHIENYNRLKAELDERTNNINND